MSAPVRLYADGGTLGKNPSVHGVYWSVAYELDGRIAMVVSRAKDYRYRTNNDAEWLALNAALAYAREHFTDRPVIVHSDSRLIVHQFTGAWHCRIERHHRWRTAARLAAESLRECIVEWRPRRVLVARLGH